MYAALSDLPRHAEWAVHSIAIEPVEPGPARVGGQYTSTHAYASGSDRLTITQLVPNESIAFEVLMPNGFEFLHRLTLAPDGQGTRVERDVRVLRLPGLMALMRPLIPFIAREHEAGFMDNLKAALDADAPSSPTASAA